MHFSALKPLVILTLSPIFAVLALPNLVPRSIPALQGWSERNYTGRHIFSEFCTPGFCCNITVIKGYTEIPWRVPVLSVNTLDAAVTLKKGAVGKLWAWDDCSGESITTFNPFTGIADLGELTIIGAVSFTNPPRNVTKPQGHI